MVGLAAWIGLTVVAATRIGPGEDATPVLRTFAGVGGVVLAAMFLAGAVGASRGAGRAQVELLERLALVPLTDAQRRSAATGARPLAWWYLAMGALVSALGLGAIALGTDRALRVLLGLALVVVAVWVVGAVRVVRRLPTTAAVLLVPLGLQVTEVPRILVPGTRALRGPLSMAGRRHGHDVTVNQTPRSAVTEVRRTAVSTSGASWTPARMAAATGLAARTWREVEVRETAAAVTVARYGNGAGRWLLHDLLLAEAVAAARPAGGRR